MFYVTNVCIALMHTGWQGIIGFSLFLEYEPIFALLQEVQGSLQTRLFFLQNVIKEAAR